VDEGPKVWKRTYVGLILKKKGKETEELKKKNTQPVCLIQFLEKLWNRTSKNETVSL